MKQNKDTIDLSIIVPCFNEEMGIDNFIDHLFAQLSGKNSCEIILADGGSKDATAEKVKRFDNVTFLNTPKGRARQMNCAAEHARGKIFYFLHADSFPPKHFDQLIFDYYAQGKQAGCFKMKFDSKHPWLMLMAQFTKVNHKSCRGGDQSLFVEKGLFDEIGGYDESYIVYEDNNFIGKLYDKNEFCIINKWLTTSARKYREIGFLRLQWLYMKIYYKRYNGATPQELLDYYNRVVKAM